MRRLINARFFIPVVLLCGIAATTYLASGFFAEPDVAPDLRSISPNTKDAARPANALPRTYEAQTGSRYLPPPSNPFRAPMVRELTVPAFADTNAIWGATGRDDAGGIWMGVSASNPQMSAHLMHYDPVRNVWQDRGGVVDQLRTAGLARPGEGQIKIHTKIIPADDGRLYFASSDDEDEKASPATLPRWGGHLWRIDPRTNQWQHLLATAEGLVAVAGVGRYVYTLGYWNHVLYQFDTANGATKRVVVGSAHGHVSRNLVADARGHVYVPRVIARLDGKALADLVEYDANLKEVAATPLEYYFGNEAPATNHGIVAMAYLADGRIVFNTHRGHLYSIEPNLARPATVTAVGWFHPAGEAYAASLFSFTGKSLLAGIAHRGERYEWVVYDLESRFSSAFMLDTGRLKNVLLHGSVSRDNAGRFYVGGWASGPTGNPRPLVLQITPMP
jgi:hypothetical protein